jgi:probable addiction module antidote protein
MIQMLYWVSFLNTTEALLSLLSFLSSLSFESYEQDGDTEVLLLAMRHVAEAQGGISELAKRTTISREHLYDILASKHNPRLDNWLDILSALGFRVRLEQQKAPAEQRLTYFLKIFNIAKLESNLIRPIMQKINDI